MGEDELMTGYDIILIGCGNMGSALASGLIEADTVERDRFYCADRKAERADALADDLGVESVDADRVFGQFASLARRVFIIAVKPDDVRGVIERGAPTFSATDTVVSIAAGVPTRLLTEWAGDDPAVVRAMPNTPALAGAGVTGVLGKNGADMDVVRALFEGVGRVVELEKEKDFDALTAVSGSGPAYVFTAIEALADGAVSMGLNRTIAVELATETLFGAAKLARDRDAHTAQLKDDVASPGGTTITGLAELEKHGFRNALIQAVRAAANKSIELTEKLVAAS